MKIILTSVFVDDQAEALKFYTEELGFLKKNDISAGNHRWLTVVSPDGPQDVELLLEPNENSAVKTFQNALFQQGIPLATFSVIDIDAEYLKLSNSGVHFQLKPTKLGNLKVAILDDTCGNLIQIVQGD